jgi:hypothetical protein
MRQPMTNPVQQSSAMILIIAEPTDKAALWLGAALTGFTNTRVQIITPSQLSYAPAVSHWLTTSEVDLSFKLANGTNLQAQQVVGVINRMIVLPLAHLQRAQLREFTYAQGELYAFALGWLSTLTCPVLNPPTPEALCGSAYSFINTQHYAISAGLACRSVSLTPDHPDPAFGSPTETQIHVVFDDQVIGPIVSIRDRDTLIQFARLWGRRMVQIETEMAGGERRFVAATSLIDFPRAGNLLVRAIARVFEG